MTLTPQLLAQEVETLFSLPDVALRLNELIDQPDTSTQDLVEVVQLDAAIAATVLRLANSAWYGLPSKVDTISRAITLIGQKALRDLVLSTSVIARVRGAGIPEGTLQRLNPQRPLSQACHQPIHACRQAR